MIQSEYKTIYQLFRFRGLARIVCEEMMQIVNEMDETYPHASITIGIVSLVLLEPVSRFRLRLIDLFSFRNVVRPFTPISISVGLLQVEFLNVDRPQSGICAWISRIRPAAERKVMYGVKA